MSSRFADPQREAPLGAGGTTTAPVVASPVASRPYLCIPGTWALTGAQWWHPGSPWAGYLHSLGWDMLPVRQEDAFWWSTDVDGTVTDRGHSDWRAGGVALRYYLRPPLYVSEADFVPLEHRCLIAHSHGLQVVLYACGQYGLKIDTLISVCSPVRADMRRLAETARGNIRRWVHCYDPGWADRWQVLGALFDGHLGVTREHPCADVNVRVSGGHSGLLNDPGRFSAWTDILCAAR